MSRNIVIGSRGSDLALAQTNHVAACIRAVAPEINVSVRIISTKGDRVTAVPLAMIGGKGLFTQELESALLDGHIDLAVHSLKDLPTSLPAGLCLAAVPPREDPADAFISLNAQSVEELPRGARVGTSSLRRKVQLLAARPDLEVVDLRGNVPTRLKKLESEGLDAIVLACAGLKRLGLDAHITQALPPQVMLSAVGQGALGIECREDDAALRAILAKLHDNDTFAEVTAERALLHEIGGGCQTPVAALGRVSEGVLTLHACIASVDGAEALRISREAPMAEAEALGRETARALLGQGAQRLMTAPRHASDALRGKRIVVTRAATQAGGLAERLEALGAQVLALPTIEIRGIVPETDIAGPHDYDWIVFTSANGAHFFAEALIAKGLPWTRYREASVCAIGPSTAEAVLRAGLAVTLVPDDYIAEAVVEKLKRIEGGLAGKRFLLPRGNLARPLLPDALRAAGAEVTELIVYETVRAEVTTEAIESVIAARPELLCFTSASTVENFVAALAPEQLARFCRTARFASIGPVTSRAANDHHLAIAVEAAQFDVPGLVTAIVGLFSAEG